MTTTRRRIVAALGLSALACGSPFALAELPPGKVVRVGMLDNLRDKFEPEAVPLHGALVEGLRSKGLEIGRNVALEYRSARGQPEKFPELAADLVRLKVDVIVAIVNQGMLAARDATRTIPIVMVGGTDPVAMGMIASLARPGGNVTGLAVNATEISAKRVQLLKEAVPKLQTVAVLWNSSFKSMEMQFHQVETAAPGLGVKVLSLRLSSADNFDQAFTAIRKARPEGMIVLFGPLRGNDLPRIVEFASANAIPTVFEIDQGVRGGGLMEFGPDRVKMARQAGAYIDKIANGANPGDLPVEEPTSFELVINMKVARAMGLSIPPALMLRASRVIE
jgi:putative ABC transport system substrate-binding protein